MFRSPPSLGPRFIPFATAACYVLSLAVPLFAQNPSPPPPVNPPSTNPDSTAKPATNEATQQVQEVSSRDTPATFKVRVNNVLVRVVVRDAKGRVVPDLKKEDFQVYDGKKLQTISSFTVETPQSHTASALSSSAGEGSSSSADVIAGKAAILPQRFGSMLFDDVHLSMEDTVFVRDAATKFFGALAPSDRVAINTTS